MKNMNGSTVNQYVRSAFADFKRNGHLVFGIYLTYNQICVLDIIACL